MGLINKQWDVAMSEMGREFSQAEQDAGWPVSMRPIQLACLQRPWRVGDAQSKHFCTRLYRRIEQACEGGDLPNETTTKRTTVSAARMVDTQKKAELFGATTRVVYTAPAVHKDITVVVVTAPSFATWLAKQAEAPSAHIQAWFDAVGVDGQTTPDVNTRPLASAPTTNVTKDEKQDLVAPLIEKALRESGWGKAAAHAVLIRWANEEVPPFLAGLDDGSIKVDGGKTIKSEAIKARLKRAIKKKMTLADDN